MGVDIERLCEVMHDAYEVAAAEAGWATQQASRKPWADVPEANKATMRVAVAAVVAAVQGPIKAEALREAVIAMGDDWRLCSYDRDAYDWLRARAAEIEAQP